MSLASQELRTIMETFGTIARLSLDMTISGKFALVEFLQIESAEEAIICGQFIHEGCTFRIVRALRTAVVYTPHDVVFGKPMAIGRHVMAVNPTLVTNSILGQREQCLRRVDYEIKKIMGRISSFLPGLDNATDS